MHECRKEGISLGYKPRWILKEGMRSDRVYRRTGGIVKGRKARRTNKARLREKVRIPRGQL